MTDNNIGAVRKILRESIDFDIEKAAAEICQLFSEPKPELEPAPRFDKVFREGLENMEESKSGEARLLTNEELDDIGYPILPLGDRSAYKRVAKAQDARTESIVRKQEQERIFVTLLDLDSKTSSYRQFTFKVRELIASERQTLKEE